MWRPWLLPLLRSWPPLEGWTSFCSCPDALLFCLLPFRKLLAVLLLLVFRVRPPVHMPVFPELGLCIPKIIRTLLPLTTCRLLRSCSPVPRLSLWFCLLLLLALATFNSLSSSCCCCIRFPQFHRLSRNFDFFFQSVDPFLCPVSPILFGLDSQCHSHFLGFETLAKGKSKKTERTEQRNNKREFHKKNFNKDKERQKNENRKQRNESRERRKKVKCNSVLRTTRANANALEEWSSCTTVLDKRNTVQEFTVWIYV